MNEAQPAYAIMYKVDLDNVKTYVIKATREDQPPVHAFASMREGLDYFEGGYNRGLARGGGFVGGAILFWLQMQPRVFHFGSLDVLQKLLGEIVHPLHLNGTGVHEVVFRCLDQEEAAKVYQAAVEPRLTPA